MFLVLHGQTEWNRDGRLQGHSDSPLTDEGCRQAERAGTILRAHLRGPARIIASPLGRTQATARIVARCLDQPESSIETDIRIAELRLGCWEGLDRGQISSGWPDRWKGPTRNSWFFNAPDGEDYDAIRARLRSWYTSFDEHDSIVAVSHGIAGRVLRGIHQTLDKDIVCELEVARDAPFHLHANRVDKLALP